MDKTTFSSMDNLQMQWLPLLCWPWIFWISCQEFWQLEKSKRAYQKRSAPEAAAFHRITEGLGLGGPPAALGPALLQQGHPEQVAQHCVWRLLKCSMEVITHPPGCLCSITCTAQMCSWCSEGTSCVPLYDHCLLSWHWAPLTEPGSVLLRNHNLPSGIYGHGVRSFLSLLFSSLNSPTCPSFSSEESVPVPVHSKLNESTLFSVGLSSIGDPKEVL